MTINLGGQQYTEEQIIVAIAASNDADHSHTFSTYSSLEEIGGVLQAVLHRLAALEDRLPLSRAGYAVTTTTTNGVTKHRVSTLDPNGKTVITTYEIPTT